MVIEREVARGTRETVFHKLQGLSGKRLVASEEVQAVRAYASDWTNLEVEGENLPPVEPGVVRIDLPTKRIRLRNRFTAPSTKQTHENAIFEKEFNWDSLQHNKAILLLYQSTGNTRFLELAKGQIQNLEDEYKELGFVPNGSDITLMRTQISFLAEMVMDYYQITGDREWLKEKFNFVEEEHKNVWMLTEEAAKAKGLRYPNLRVREGSLLARPSGFDIVKNPYDAVAVTGQDDSTEYAGHAYDFLPVSINAALYNTDIKLSEIAHMVGDEAKAEKWEEIGERRRQEIQCTLHDPTEERFVNYNMRQGRKDTRYRGLTSYMALWAGIATPEQAAEMVRQLGDFETDYGLTIATKDSSPSREQVRRYKEAMLGVDAEGQAERFFDAFDDLMAKKQWDYPNIWAPMSYFTIMGLVRYGYQKEAKRLIEKSLRGLAAFYAEKRTLPEKINGETGANGQHYLYNDQEGFGWTNAFVVIMCHLLEQLDTQTQAN